MLGGATSPLVLCMYQRKNCSNPVGNRVHNYTKLINSFIQAAIIFLERHMDSYRIRVILFSTFKVIRVSSLEQGIKAKKNLV